VNAYTRVYPKVSGLSRRNKQQQKHSPRSNTKDYGGKTHKTDSQNSDTTAPGGRGLYHLQFSLQAASPETFGYTLIKFIPTWKCISYTTHNDRISRGYDCYLRILYIITIVVVVRHMNYILVRLLCKGNSHAVLSELIRFGATFLGYRIPASYNLNENRNIEIISTFYSNLIENSCHKCAKTWDVTSLHTNFFWVR
jgi:hypothetical protein